MRVAWFLVSTLLFLPGTFAAGGPCLQYAVDPAGDQTVPATTLVDTSPADVLNVSMEWMDQGILMAGQLAGDPRTVDGFTYSYWIGFQDGGRSAGGNPPTWTWQGDSSYERILTMYWNRPDGYEVDWSNDTFRFLIPWDDFEAQYGVNATGDIGSPRLSTSGPVPMGTGTNNPGQDSAYYSLDLVPMGPCVTQNAERQDDGPAGDEQSTSGPSVVVLILGLILVGRRLRTERRVASRDV